MAFDWQHAATAAIIAWGAWYVVRPLVRSAGAGKPTSACGGCRSCGGDAHAAAAPRVVPLNVPAPTSEGRSEDGEPHPDGP